VIHIKSPLKRSQRQNPSRHTLTPVKVAPLPMIAKRKVDSNPISLSPEKVELQTAFPEGVEFQAEFTLENKIRSVLVVKKVLSSCGCTAISTKEGQLLEMSFVLFPSQPFPILVTVDTKNREGKNGVSVMFPYEYGGKSFGAVGNILFEVIEHKVDDVSE
jgi:hypothetical protein